MLSFNLISLSNYVYLFKKGNPKDAGILPRALDVLFNSINNRQWNGMDLKPKLFMDVSRLSAEQEAEERKAKEKIMKLSCDDVITVSVLRMGICLRLSKKKN